MERKKSSIELLQDRLWELRRDNLELYKQTLNDQVNIVRLEGQISLLEIENKLLRIGIDRRRIENGNTGT